jgi:predicted DNA-binding protein (MmcQ/YjbR family)
MNKVHWNTVTLGGDVSKEDLKRMVAGSHDLCTVQPLSVIYARL